MKNVLLMVHDDDGQESRLQVALDVTRALEGHLECLDVAVLPNIVGDYYSNAGQAYLIEDERARESANRERIESRLAGEGVSWTWTDTLDVPSEAIDRAAALADLIVVSSAAGEQGTGRLRGLAANVAERSNRPVLTVPPTCEKLDPAAPALIAWDGSREASDALRAAVPLLALSSDIVLLDIDAKRGLFAAGAAATYLSRHDLHPRIEIVQREERRSVAETIIEQARGVGAAYVVMGAFGRSSLIEGIFGGVTRTMLEEADRPLFLLH